MPFFHDKPTYEDVIVASPDRDGVLSWNSRGLSPQRICDRLIEDSGRWGMILDYELLEPRAAARPAFGALHDAGERLDIVVEGCFGPKDGEPGRARLAVPAGLGVERVLEYLASQGLPLRLVLVHPVGEAGSA
ncbi:MAG: hypothetical protein QM767_26785 [Anaeromyxobacter sp.]